MHWGPRRTPLARTNPIDPRHHCTIAHLEWLGRNTGGNGDRRRLILAGYQAMVAYERELMTRLIEGLQALSTVTIHGITDPAKYSDRVPTVSFTHARVSSRALARSLGEHRINVWWGHNYAYEAARLLGLDEEAGVLRIGLAHYNTMEEVERVLSAIEELTR